MGCPKRPYGFSCKIKDMFFIFTNNFIDLDILSMLAISSYWLLLGRGQGCCYTFSNAWDSPTAKNYLAKIIVPRDSANLFWHIQSVTAPSPYTAQIFFLHFSYVFTFLEIIKHNMLKILHILLLSSVLKWLHKNSLILMFF